jgi:hypothetical protein
MYPPYPTICYEQVSFICGNLSETDFLQARTIYESNIMIFYIFDLHMHSTDAQVYEVN